MAKGPKPIQPMAFYPTYAAGLGDIIPGAVTRSFGHGGNERIDAATERAIQQGVRSTRGGYGARGLAGSGIAISGEQDVASDIALKAAQQERAASTDLLRAGTWSPSIGQPQAQQPRGLFGMK